MAHRLKCTDRRHHWKGSSAPGITFWEAEVSIYRTREGKEVNTVGLCTSCVGARSYSAQTRMNQSCHGLVHVSLDTLVQQLVCSFCSQKYSTGLAQATANVEQSGQGELYSDQNIAFCAPLNLLLLVKNNPFWMKSCKDFHGFRSPSLEGYL